MNNWFGMLSYAAPLIPFANCLRSLSVQLFLEQFDDELKAKLSSTAGSVITGASSLHVDVGSGIKGLDILDTMAL